MIQKTVQIQNLDPDQIWYSLHARAEGLDDKQVAERLLQAGENTLEIKDPLKLAKSFLRQFTNFFTILLNLSAVICFIADSIQPGEGMGVLGYALFSVSFLNMMFSFFQEYRAEKAMEALKKFLPDMIKVRRNGQIVNISAKQIVPGDILIIAEGDRIPADARIFTSANLLINNAPLTGESRPVSASEKASNLRIEESPNILFAGCNVLRGHGEAVVFATGLRTEFGKLARLSQKIKRSSSPLEKETSHMIRVLTVIAVTMGLIFFSWGMYSGRSLWINLVFMMGIIVANVPEGLLPTYTLALAMGSIRMAKKNVLVKGLSAVEGLGAVHVICTDKTGTLTENRLSLTEIKLFNGESLNEAGRNKYLNYCYLASDLIPVGDGFSGDPLDLEIYNKIKRSGESLFESELIREFSFDAALRRSAAVVRIADKYFYIVKGAWEVIEPGLSSFFTDSSLEKSLQSDENIKSTAKSTMLDLASRGLRVLCAAYCEIEKDEAMNAQLEQANYEKKLFFLGFMGVEDPVRKEVPDAVRKCLKAGIDVILITGDHPDTALSVAKQCGIAGNSSQEVMTGSRLAELTREELMDAIQSGVRIFARSTPEQKMKIVTALKSMDKVTAMTGDGVNDAPALKAADVGIAMGKSGTDVARESAQIILLDDNFASIVSGVEEGRTVFSNIRKFTNYVLVSNGPEIIPYLLYILFPIPLALNVLHILTIDLGTDIIPSMALGQEPPDPEVMDLPPRKSEGNLMDWRLILHSYGFLGILEGIWSLFLFFMVLVSGGWHYGEVLSAKDPLLHSASGIALATILLMQIGNLIGRRYKYKSGLDTGIWKNKLMFAGIMIQIVFSWVLLYVPAVNRIMSTGPVDVQIYMLAWLGIPLIFISDWIRKKISFRI